MTLRLPFAVLAVLAAPVNAAAQSWGSASDELPLRILQDGEEVRFAGQPGGVRAIELSRGPFQLALDPELLRQADAGDRDMRVAVSQSTLVFDLVSFDVSRDETAFFGGATAMALMPSWSSHFLTVGDIVGHVEGRRETVGHNVIRESDWTGYGDRLMVPIERIHPRRDFNGEDLLQTADALHFVFYLNTEPNADSEVVPSDAWVRDLLRRGETLQLRIVFDTPAAPSSADGPAPKPRTGP